MWRSEADRQAAARHEWQVRSVTRVMLPMMDVASLVERTPESERRRTAEHERLARMMAEHAIEVGETSPGVMRRLATWVEAHVAGLSRRHESSEAAGMR